MLKLVADVYQGFIHGVKFAHFYLLCKYQMGIIVLLFHPLKYRPCYDGEWGIKGIDENPRRVGPCTLFNNHEYWCPVTISSPDKKFEHESPHDTWGDCQLSCMDKNNTS